VQVNKEFYKPPQRSVFEVVLYYNGKGKIERNYFDVFSNNTAHDSHFVKCALKKVFNHNDFSKHKFSELSLWMDNCPNHFKTKEVFSYFSCLDIRFKRVRWNYFIEYHGKGPCDTRFSQISTMLHDHNLDSNNFRITSTMELIEAIKLQQHQHNVWRESEKTQNSLKSIIFKSQTPKTSQKSFEC